MITREQIQSLRVTGVYFDSSTGFSLPNGAQLGWLIDPYAAEVYIYRPSVDVEKLAAPNALSGEPELPGFKLDLRPFWK